MTDEKQEVGDEQIPLRFRIPAKTHSLMAQHLLVQNLGEVFQLSFYEMIPPPIFPNNNEEEALEQLKQAGVTAECVARINVPASRFRGFAEAMQQVVAEQASNVQE